jgi:hypothetical protein
MPVKILNIRTSKAISGRFRSNALSWKVSSKQVSNEGCLSDTVLTDQEHLRFGFEKEGRK